MDHKLNKMHILRHIVDVKNVCFAVRVPFWDVQEVHAGNTTLYLRFSE